MPSSPTSLLQLVISSRRFLLCVVVLFITIFGLVRELSLLGSMSSYFTISSSSSSSSQPSRQHSAGSRYEMNPSLGQVIESSSSSSGTKAIMPADISNSSSMAKKDIHTATPFGSSTKTSSSSSSLNQDTTKTIITKANMKPDFVISDKIRNAALAKLQSYEPTRGVRYLYEQYGLLLLVNVYQNSKQKGKVVIEIRNANNEDHEELEDIDCKSLKLSLWVRLAGPEIISGLASYDSDCTWRYETPEPVTRSGNYEIFVKTLSILDDGVDNFYRPHCQEKGGGWIWNEETSVPIGNFTIRAYGGPAVCCEVCTRMNNRTPNDISGPKCNYWTYRDKEQPQCLFYESVGEQIKSNYSGWKSGTSIQKNLPEYQPLIFLGCGWAAGNQNDCRDNGRDDIPYLITSNITIRDDGTNTIQQRKESETSQLLPVCDSTTLEGVNYGRWVQSSPTMNCTMVVETPQVYFPGFVHLSYQPEECWIHDRLIGNKCEKGCGRNPIPNLWKSPLQEPSDMFKYVWKPYRCHLPLYTDEMLTQCIKSKGLEQPKVIGDSVMKFFSYYIDHRFDKLYKDYSTGTAIAKQWNVTTSNFQMLHRLWWDSNEVMNQTVHKWESKLFPPGIDSTKDTKGIYLHGPFLTSEREIHVTPGRMDQLGKIWSPVIAKHGVLQIDWRNVSMALSHEMATQYDGLHVVGSPMKMLFHMVAHHICG